MNMIADKNFTLVIEDGSTLFYALNDIPRNFKEICLKLFGMVSSVTFDMFSALTCVILVLKILWKEQERK